MLDKDFTASILGPLHHTPLPIRIDHQPSSLAPLAPRGLKSLHTLFLFSLQHSRNLSTRLTRTTITLVFILVCPLRHGRQPPLALTSLRYSHLITITMSSMRSRSVAVAPVSSSGGRVSSRRARSTMSPISRVSPATPSSAPKADQPDMTKWLASQAAALMKISSILQAVDMPEPSEADLDAALEKCRRGKSAGDKIIASVLEWSNPEVHAFVKDAMKKIEKKQEELTAAVRARDARAEEERRERERREAEVAGAAAKAEALAVPSWRAHLVARRARSAPPPSLSGVLPSLREEPSLPPIPDSPTLPAASDAPLPSSAAPSGASSLPLDGTETLVGAPDVSQPRSQEGENADRGQTSNTASFGEASTTAAPILKEEPVENTTLKTCKVPRGYLIDWGTPEEALAERAAQVSWYYKRWEELKEYIRDGDGGAQTGDTFPLLFFHQHGCPEFEPGRVTDEIVERFLAFGLGGEVSLSTFKARAEKELERWQPDNIEIYICQVEPGERGLMREFARVFENTLRRLILKAQEQGELDDLEHLTVCATEDGDEEEDKPQRFCPDHPVDFAGSRQSADSEWAMDVDAPFTL